MSEHEHENGDPDAEPVEPIEGDDGDEGGEGGEDQTAPEAAAAEGSAELLEKADKENQRYHRALARILGDDPTRHPCEACDGLGVKWGEVAALPSLKQAEDAEPCPVCDALGIALTGSKQPGQDTKPCTACGGRGWREKVNLSPAPLPLPTSTHEAAQTLQGQWVPGRGFIPYGESEPLPGTGGQA